MDLSIFGCWAFVFTIIISFLGGLTYLIEQKYLIHLTGSNFIRQSQEMSRNNTKPHRKSNRSKKNKQVLDSNVIDDNVKENEINNATTSNDNNGDNENSITNDINDNKSLHQNEQQMEQHENINSCSNYFDNESDSNSFTKQRKKSITNPKPTSLPLKPQASVAPVRQSFLTNNQPKNPKFYEPYCNGNYKSYDYQSPSSFSRSFSSQNLIPPRFRKSKDQETPRRQRRRKDNNFSKESSFSAESVTQSNEFVPTYVQQNGDKYNYEPNSSIHAQQEEPVKTTQNDYSSESDFVTDSASSTGQCFTSSLPSQSIGSTSSFQTLDSTHHEIPIQNPLSEIISMFDTTPLSYDELDLILSKLAGKLSLKQDDEQKSSKAIKEDKTVDRILDEKHTAEMKILAIELRAAKERILELTKANSNLQNLSRYLYYHSPANTVYYNQTFYSYQMHMRRLQEENVRLHQSLHEYTTLPIKMTQLQQQNDLLHEQVKELTSHNSNLQRTLYEKEQAVKNAKDIYLKASNKNHAATEQTIADRNQFQHLSNELKTLRTNYDELQNSSKAEIDKIKRERDDLLKKYEQLIGNQSDDPKIELQDKINNLKVENDQLRQKNKTIMENLNNLLREQQNTTT